MNGNVNSGSSSYAGFITLGNGPNGSQVIFQHSISIDIKKYEGQSFTEPDFCSVCGHCMKISANSPSYPAVKLTFDKCFALKYPELKPYIENDNVVLSICWSCVLEPILKRRRNGKIKKKNNGIWENYRRLKSIYQIVRQKL